MTWSIDHNLTLYLVIAAGLVASCSSSLALARPGIAQQGVSGATDGGPLGAALDLAQPQPRGAHHAAGPPADGGVSDRRIPKHEPGISPEPVANARAVDQERRGFGAAWQRPAIQKYGFGRELFAVPAPEETLSGLADESRLGRALEQLPSRFGETLPFGVFVFSDGRSTETEPWQAIGRAFRTGRADPRRAGG